MKVDWDMSETSNLLLKLSLIQRKGSNYGLLERFVL